MPFENLSIHEGEPIVLNDDALFEKIVGRRRGGFCYELNGLFAALLRALGFEVAMLSAQVANARGEFGPDFDHMTLMVTLATRWLADVGFGDSFLEPLLLDERREQVQGERAYRIDLDGARTSPIRLVGGKPQLNGIRSQQAANVQRSIHLQAVALWLLGGLLGLVTLAVLSQLLARQASVEAAEHPTLRALGMTRGQLWALGMMRATAMGVVAAALAGVVAVAASPFTPIGTARLAEPHPGVTLDWLVLLVGAAGTLVLVVAVAAWPLWRATAVAHVERAPGVAGAGRPSLLSRAVAGPALSPSMSAGVRMALEPGRGRTAVPVRSSLLAIVVAVASLVGALTFAGSLDHLLATPRLYGWNWDAHVTTNSGSLDAATIVKALAPDPRVQDMAMEDTPPLAIGKTEFDALALIQAKGWLEPVVLEGRSPRGAGEVALGTETMRKAHARVGSTVTMHITAIAPLPKPFRVVGRVVMAPRSDTSRLGSGAVMDYAGVERMIPPDVHPPPLSDVDLRLAPGVDRARALADIGRKLGKDYTVSTAQRPADLVNFGRVQNLPLMLRPPWSGCSAPPPWPRP